MAAWSDWTTDVAIDVPGCPSLTIEWAVRRTVIDFLEKTHYLQRTTDAIDVASGASARSFSTPVVSATERVLAVLGAWLNDEPLPIRGPDDVNADWPDWQARTGDPECLVMERPDAYWVVPAPTATMTGALRFKIADATTETATTCDDLILVNWRDAIASGTKARLMSMQNQAWTLPQMAAFHWGIYEEAIGAAKVAALRSPARSRLVTKPYWF